MSGLVDGLIEAASVDEALEQLGAGAVTERRSLGGGCINNGTLLTCSGGQRFFLKTNSARREGLFRGEAAGLAALGRAEGPRVPEPLALGDPPAGAAAGAGGSGRGEQFLLLEFIPEGRRTRKTMEDFGREMARLHRSGRSPRAGFEADNHIGATPQPNRWTEDWIDFFREQRLGFQVELAARKGLADRGMRREVEGIMARLEELLIPPEEGQCSLIHGDLWGGNYMVDEEGRAVLIDPAVYFGHREADLAMTELFGGFDRRFYEAYREEWPLEAGFEERSDLYNLYHMLNHLNLFGGGYAGSVRSICRRYR